MNFIRVQDVFFDDKATLRIVSSSDLKTKFAGYERIAE
jgi:hypothetical protein